MPVAYEDIPLPLREIGMTPDMVREALQRYMKRDEVEVPTMPKTITRPKGVPYDKNWARKERARLVDKIVLAHLMNNDDILAGEISAQSGLAPIAIGRAVRSLRMAGYDIKATRFLKGNMVYCLNEMHKKRAI